MKSKNILIIGGEGHGSVIESCINDNKIHGYGKDLTVCGYVNDYEKEIDGLPVLGGTDDIMDLIQEDYYFAWGIHLIERNILTYGTYLRMNIPEERLVSIIHYSAFIGRNVEIGAGSLVMSNAYIAPRTRIGNATMVKANACIGHDVVCGPCCHFAMHSTTGSYSSLGICSDVAINSVVLEKRHVGNFAMVGASSLLTHDVPDHEIYVGNPAVFFKEMRKD